MPIPKHTAFTSEDYWRLPEGRRAELIDGELFDMAPPSLEHQRLVLHIARKLADYVEANGGPCEVLVAPCAVNLDADDSTWVEPDISVVCDPTKLSKRGCEGAPDLVVEVVSPGSRQMDYLTKLSRYSRAGVREYWICDPDDRQTVVYRFGPDGPRLARYPFNCPVPVRIWNGLDISMDEAQK